VPDSLLILAPLLVLAVVLLLGFAGCTFHEGVQPTRTLTFRLRVSTELTVDGVTFSWTRPNGTTESATVPSPSSGPSVDAYLVAAQGLAPALLWTLGAVNGLSDRSGHGHDGTALGNVTVGGVADGPTVFFDARATLFDGTDDGIGSSYNPFVGTNGRTFVGWARWDAGGPAEYTLFGSSAGDAARPTLRIVVATRDVKWLPSGSNGQVIIWPAAAPAEDTWFMWALRANPGNNNASLFIDGVKVSDQAMTDEWPAAPGTFQAAIGATAKQPFKGAQALIAVYGKGVPDAELAALYQASEGPGDDVYEYTLPSPDHLATPESGDWTGRCDLTVQSDGQAVPGDSGDFAFHLPATGESFVLAFHATAPPVVVMVIGLS